MQTTENTAKLLVVQASRVAFRSSSCIGLCLSLSFSLSGCKHLFSTRTPRRLPSAGDHARFFVCLHLTKSTDMRTRVYDATVHVRSVVLQLLPLDLPLNDLGHCQLVESAGLPAHVLL